VDTPRLSSLTDPPVQRPQLLTAIKETDQSIQSTDDVVVLRDKDEKPADVKDEPVSCVNGLVKGGSPRHRNLPKPVQRFIRSFRTVRRTLGKSFRRSFCASAKSSSRRKDDDDQSGEVDGLLSANQIEPLLTSSSNRLTVSVNISSPCDVPPVAKKIIVHPGSLRSGELILSARLLHRRLEQQERMVC